jgi:hypothetical protein
MRLTRLTSLVCLAVAVAATLATARAQEAPPFLDISMDSKPAEVSSGAALVVTAKVGWRGPDGSGEKVWTRRGDAVEARLRYRAMWGEERSVPMRPATGSNADDAQAPYATLTAAIPANELPKRGEMVRYWVVVFERGGSNASARKPKREADFYGAVVDAASIARETSLPTLHWFVEDVEGARWDYPVESFLAFDQSRGGGEEEKKIKFYGKGVTARRRGSGRRGDPNMWGKGGTKDWPKRKYKFDFRGRDFEIFWRDGDERMTKVEEINAHSAYDEPGSESWLRESLAASAMRRLGVPASAAQHVVLRRNGLFHGLYVLVEQVDEAFLERRGLDPTGALYKAVHWKLSNLRPPAPEWAPCRYDGEWELGWGACPEVYRYSTPSKHATDDRARDAEWHLGKLLDALARVNGDGDAAALYGRGGRRQSRSRDGGADGDAAPGPMREKLLHVSDERRQVDPFTVGHGGRVRDGLPFARCAVRRERRDVLPRRPRDVLRVVVRMVELAVLLRRGASAGYLHRERRAVHLEPPRERGAEGAFVARRVLPRAAPRDVAAPRRRMVGTRAPEQSGGDSNGRDARRGEVGLEPSRRRRGGAAPANTREA